MENRYLLDTLGELQGINGLEPLISVIVNSNNMTLMEKDNIRTSVIKGMSLDNICIGSNLDIDWLRISVEIYHLLKCTKGGLTLNNFFMTLESEIEYGSLDEYLVEDYREDDYTRGALEAFLGKLLTTKISSNVVMLGWMGRLHMKTCEVW